MQRLDTVAGLREALRERRRRGERIAFVPTMGALHDGHLSLVDAARQAGDVVVMSVFVNPLQFGPGEDLSRYPRDLEGDAAKAAARGVDVLFIPSADVMYPGTRAVEVRPIALAERWEGGARPGHFAGVLTVVAKLFNLVQPDAAVFGQKDIQQATLVRALVRDLDFPVQLIVAPTVRDADGLALSSRNVYLAPDERARALALSRALHGMARDFAGGTDEAAALLATARDTLAGAGVTPEYLALAHPDTLDPVAVATRGTIAMVAARVGTTRLIDNVILGA